eukprot:scaffold309018_cov18-Tisochrysis_lutea.AAC.1
MCRNHREQSDTSRSGNHGQQGTTACASSVTQLALAVQPHPAGSATQQMLAVLSYPAGSVTQVMLTEQHTTVPSKHCCNDTAFFLLDPPALQQPDHNGRLALFSAMYGEKR